MEHGLLPKQEAEKVFEKKQQKSQLQKLTSPMKSCVKTSTKSVTVKNIPSPSAPSNKKPPAPVSKDASKQSKKRKTEDISWNDDSDDDFMVASRNRIAKRKKQAA